jgi:hypothetical protein
MVVVQPYRLHAGLLGVRRLSPAVVGHPADLLVDLLVDLRVELFVADPPVAPPPAGSKREPGTPQAWKNSPVLRQSSTLNRLAVPISALDRRRAVAAVA